MPTDRFAEALVFAENLHRRQSSWEERKRHHIAKLKSAGRDVALVTAADKLHNLTAMVRDLRREGPGTLQRFNAPDRLVWYFEQIAEALEPHADRAPIAELWDGAAVLRDLMKTAA